MGCDLIFMARFEFKRCFSTNKYFSTSKHYPLMNFYSEVFVLRNLFYQLDISWIANWCNCMKTL